MSSWLGAVIELHEPTGSPEFAKLRAGARRIQKGQEDHVQLWKAQHSVCVPQSVAGTEPGGFAPSVTAFSPQRFLPLPLCSSTHELPRLTKGIANHILQLRSLQHRSLSAMIPYYFTVPNLSKQSCHTTDSILLSKHILATLDCSSAASAPLCLF